MRLLILGGTGFLGRHLVQAALARNHQVTLFNRGQSHPDLFRQLETLGGNRDGDLQALQGRKWDAAIDTCGYTSGQVRAAARLLAAAVEHYTFVSSISVYRDFTRSGLEESAPLERLPDGLNEDLGNAETYGARKALAEQAAEQAMPQRVLSVRPGLIVGPYDATGRFLYWVQRMARGGEILAPGAPDAPVQVVDVRDLADWVIQMAEARRVGPYNATGPASGLTFQQMLEQCREATGSSGTLTWVEESFLLEQGVKPFSDLPLWLPKKHWGFFEIDCRRALAAGLAFRPLMDTMRDTLEWARAAGTHSRIGLDSARELDLLRLWKARRATQTPPNEVVERDAV